MAMAMALALALQWFVVPLLSMAPSFVQEHNLGVDLGAIPISMVWMLLAPSYLVLSIKLKKPLYCPL